MKKNWFILRVQSERENTIHDHLVSRIKAAGLDSCFGRILVPTEHVTEIRSGRKRVMEQKMYPGYMLVEVAVTDDGAIPQDAWFLIMETQGISGFVSSDQKKPLPLPADEAERILKDMEEKREKPRPKVEFQVGGGRENKGWPVRELRRLRGRRRRCQGTCPGGGFHLRALHLGGRGVCERGKSVTGRQFPDCCVE